MAIYIREIDPTITTVSLFRLWREKEAHPEFRPVIALALFYLLVTPLPLALAAAGLGALLGFEVDWPFVAVSVTLSVTLGVAAGVLLSVSTGIQWTVWGSMMWGMLGWWMTIEPCFGPFFVAMLVVGVEGMIKLAFEGDK